MAKRPEPVRLHRNGFKFYVAAIICCVMAGVSAVTFMQRLGQVPVGDLVFLAIAFVITGPMGWTLWARARDPRPELIVGPDGVQDALHGDFTWDEVDNFRLRQSWINAGFGYDLKKGVEPTEWKTSFRISRFFNAMSGLPHRAFKKQMMREPPEAFHQAFHTFRPDLDRSK